MKTQSKSRTEQILMVMYVLAWIAFIGLCIKTGAILISYGVSLVYPASAKNLFNELDLDKLRQFSFLNYSLTVTLMFAYVGMKANMIYLVIKSLSKVNLSNPFTFEMANLLEKISYVQAGIWAIAMFSNAYTSWLMKRAGTFAAELSSGEFLFMAGLVFIISQIFKRGVELQSENDLTI
jgi:hypothetical protein